MTIQLKFKPLYGNFGKRLKTYFTTFISNWVEAYTIQKVYGDAMIFHVIFGFFLIIFSFMSIRKTFG